MFIDINKIPDEGLSLDTDLTLPVLEGLGREAIRVEHAHLSGHVEQGERGADLEGHLDADLRLTCARCLESFPREMATDFNLTLVPRAEEVPEGEAEIRDDDVSLYYCTEGRADVNEIATEQVYLNLPLKPVCMEGCRGLCPECGANRNRTACDCHAEDVDPRLAPLLRFRTRSREN